MDSKRGGLGKAMEDQIVLGAEQVHRFRGTVYGYYRDRARALPWRKTNDPYKILISEVMLQQTQVARVIGKYEGFIRAFPDIESLARASLHQILTVWQGLGYNRRALALKRAAQIVVAHYGGRIPSSIESLKALPGIGSVTAHAICAFAFNEPTVFIETNIRTVFIHHFFENASDINDKEILPLVARTLDHANPRIWYYALMDYGVALKKRHGNPSRRSARYRRQSPFEGSNRQIRGMILQTLLETSGLSEDMLVKRLPFGAEAVRWSLKQLEKDGLTLKRGDHISIAQ